MIYPKRKTKFSLLIALSLLCIILSCANNSTVAKTVYVNGIIYTVEGENWDKEPQQCIAISSQGRIMFVGNNEEAEPFIGPHTEVLDLQGKVVLPGFLDTHTHPPGFTLSAMFSLLLPLSGEIDEVLENIQNFILANPDREVYWGSGFSMGLGGVEAAGRGPRKEWLDEINSDKPIIMKSFDGHNIWLNSKALEMNGITKDTTHPTGLIHKDENGELWGTLTDALDLLPMQPSYSAEQQKAALASFINNMHSRGYTGGHLIIMSLDETGSGDVYIDYLREMEKAGTLKAHTSLMLRFLPENDFNDDLTFFLNKRDDFQKNSKIKINTAKFFVDGVLEGRTAYLSEPYLNNIAMGYSSDYVSMPLWDNEILKSHFNTLMGHGIQLHIHSIGDQATTETLDALEYAHKNYPDIDARNTITHLQIMQDNDKIRMAKMGIIGSTQPFWHPKEPGFYTEVEEALLGNDRAFNTYPVKSLIEAGVLITFSSDHPVTPDPNPFWGLEVAVTRNLYSGAVYGIAEIQHQDDPTWLRNKAERITLKEAVEAYTINGAFQMFMENEIGSLKVGKWADMIIIDRDILHIDPIQISDTKLLETIFAGEVIFKFGRN